MTGKPVISVKGISKRYYIGGVPQHKSGHGLKDALLLPYRMLKGFASPFYEGGDKSFWALKDINIDVYHGEKVGIIGRNGAGKSTLLKILSRLVYPTSGEAVIFGRVTSLLEVGTGFNPNLTGRENVYLNASLYGLDREEISKRFDMIVRFSGVERFIDTPVKFYSSGMYMRLAFSVAAHLDPDILLLDEVLAVGDMTFQQKCLKRVEGLASEGRTILFVSHSMDAIVRFCTRCIWLDAGAVVKDGDAEEVVADYMRETMGITPNRVWHDNDDGRTVTSADDKDASEKASGDSDAANDAVFAAKGCEVITSPVRKEGEHEHVRVISARVLNAKNETVFSVPVCDKVGIELTYEIIKAGRNIQPAYHFKTSQGMLAFVVAYTNRKYMKQILGPGIYKSTAWVPPNLLNVGVTYVNINMVVPDPLERLILIENALSFNVHEIDDMENTARGLYARNFPGAVRPLLEWETEKL